MTGSFCLSIDRFGIHCNIGLQLFCMLIQMIHCCTASVKRSKPLIPNWNLNTVFTGSYISFQKNWISYIFPVIFPSLCPIKRSDQQLLLLLYLTPKSSGLSITLVLAHYKLVFTVDCSPFLSPNSQLLLMKGLSECSWHWIVFIAMWKEMYTAPG